MKGALLFDSSIVGYLIFKNVAATITKTASFHNDFFAICNLLYLTSQNRNINASQCVSVSIENQSIRIRPTTPIALVFSSFFRTRLIDEIHSYDFIRFLTRKLHFKSYFNPRRKWIEEY